ncbi:hypothetical protein [Dyella sp. 20L07]|uniref:hypothetical protein n=1 Tax=Dyella sp. 20L07 TaxID=3384240 RepID=UPI003D2A0D1C
MRDLSREATPGVRRARLIRYGVMIISIAILIGLSLPVIINYGWRNRQPLLSVR